MKITLTRALVELKTLDARIEQALVSAKFCGVAKGRGDKKTVHNIALTVQDYETRVSANVDALNSLIMRRDTIKAKLVEANAATPVTVAGSQYTIAGAIEAKRGIKAKQQLLDAMKSQLARAEQTIQLGNTKLNDDIEKAVAAAVGAKPTPEMYDSIANPRKDANELSLLDPLLVRNRIDSLEKAITSFLADVDVALSEVNARTEIEV